ncbi:UDP-N-acetylglucosamine transferase subunit alg14 [Penicillium capsulatum]|uniref:UDP-N-acetylglucosamine transferase subunit ALG14 n=1 Tax=Penicillium capsulatum TaxID=69766 RepID=A0A9W9LQD9_9EURO|nr:UDP-N-acetylglucosamine transferase subunit alg14 [Penicillium capsulatum]KAJ6136074.1 UDP-N-acetylglucosamine transferase subunit alg14 [Penicillium capsulatum]
MAPLQLFNLVVPAAIAAILGLLVIAVSLAYSQNAPIPKVRRRGTPVHLLVVLGSGGHTAEMFYMLDRIPGDLNFYTYRTYVVSSGDDLSADKAVEFEARNAKKLGKPEDPGSYSIVTIPRARRVHQSYLTAPFSTISCFYACILVLCGRFPGQPKLPAEYPSSHPDLIVTNGPAISVCMICAAKLLRFFIFVFRWVTARGTQPTVSRLRTMFVESWARVNTLSTSGVLLLPLADSFLVQWPALAGRRAWWGMKKTEHAGWVVV